MEALDAEVGPGVPYPKILVEIREKAKAEGLWNLFMPDERFGPGLTNWEYGLLCEEMGRSPMAAPMAFNCSAPDTGNMEILAEHGTDEQRERWLEPLLEGRIRSCFSMTEPEVSGSDPTLLQARAVLDGDEWVINGHKWFTSRRRRRRAGDRDGRHRPRRPPLRARLDDLRADRQPRLQPGPADPGDGPRQRARPLRDPLRRLPRARPPTCSASAAPASRSPRTASARAASTTACARSGPPSGRWR